MKKKIKFAKKEFKNTDLPKNRYEVFIDILKVRFDIICKSGVILFLFLIPFIFSILAKNFSLFSLKEYFDSNTIDKTMYDQSLFTIKLLFSLFEVVSLLFFSIGLSGIMNIFKRLTFYDSIQFKDDFLRGVKNNYKHNVLTFFLVGMIYVLSIIYTNIYTGSDFVSYVIFYFPVFLSCILVIPVLIFCLFQIPIYNNTYKQYLKNACFFYGKTIFKTIGIILVLSSFFAPLLIKNVYVMIISILVSSIFLLPISILVLNLYCNSIFDLYLNEKQYPEIYRKGMI